MEEEGMVEVVVAAAVAVAARRRTCIHETYAGIWLRLTRKPPKSIDTSTITIATRFASPAVFAKNETATHSSPTQVLKRTRTPRKRAIAATAADPSLEWWDLHRGRPFWTPANRSQVHADALAEQNCHGGPWPEVVGRRSHHGGHCSPRT